MGRTIQGINDLYTWCLNNGSLGQQLIREWTGLDKNNQPISINSVARATSKKVKWKCEKGHVWCAAVGSRTVSRTGCPYCAGKRTVGNTLKNWCLNHGEYGQQLLKEWTGLDWHNQPISIDSISPGTCTMVKWRCSKGHEWVDGVLARTQRYPRGCPQCEKEKGVNDIERIVVEGKNDLYTWCVKHSGMSIGKQVLSEWVGLDKDNRKIPMSQIWQSSNREVKWRCPNGHEWVASVRQRTLNGGKTCPHCLIKRQQGGK